MIASFDVRALFAELQQLPSFHCIDFQLIEEDSHMIVRATVGSARDRVRLLAAVTAKAEGKELVPMIQIDPLLNSPFCPSIPSESPEKNQKSNEIWSLAFFEGGAQLASERH